MVCLRAPFGAATPPAYIYQCCSQVVPLRVRPCSRDVRAQNTPSLKPGVLVRACVSAGPARRRRDTMFEAAFVHSLCGFRLCLVHRFWRGGCGSVGLCSFACMALIFNASMAGAAAGFVALAIALAFIANFGAGAGAAASFLAAMANGQARFND